MLCVVSISRYRNYSKRTVSGLANWLQLVTLAGLKLYLLVWQLKRRSPSPLEYTINKHTILSQTTQIKVGLFKCNLQMPPGYEARMTHVDIYGTMRWIPAHRHCPLAHYKLEVPAFQSCKGRCWRWEGHGCDSRRIRREGIHGWNSHSDRATRCRFKC